MNPKTILIVIGILLFAAGIIWDARIGMTGGIVLGASLLIPS